MLEEKPIPWRELLETLVRQRWTVLAATAIGLAIGILVAVVRPPQYQAKARILLTAEAVAGPRQVAMEERQINAELALLKSPALIRSVLKTLAEAGRVPATGPLDGATTRFSGFFPALYSRLHGISAPDPVDRMVEVIAERIRAEPLARSNVVEVAYIDRHPEWAAALVNALLESHVERIAYLGQSEAQGFYEGQQNLLAERWEKAREALAQFRQRQGFLGGDEAQIRRVIADLEVARVAAETETLELQAKIEFLDQELQKYPPTSESESRVSEDASVTFLKSRILELEIERGEKLSRFTPTSTVIQDLNGRIEEARLLLEAKRGETLAEVTTAVNPAYQALEIDSVQTRSEQSATVVRLRALDAQIAKYRDTLRRIESTGSELQRLEDEVENAAQMHRDYLQQAEDARFSNALDESRIVNVSIIDRAEVPLSPEPTRRGPFAMVGTLFGLFLGLCLAWLRDWLDPSVKGSAQAARLTGLPVIAEILAARADS